MIWNVTFTKKAKKQYKMLPKKVKNLTIALVKEIEISGPKRFNWKNYSRLSDGSYHCHLTYRFIACWRETKKGIQVEVYHVSTREKAPY